MKKFKSIKNYKVIYNVFLYCFYFFIIIFMAYSSYADWTLSGTTITDGDWTLNVGISGSRLTVSGVSAGGIGSNSDLDLAAPVSDDKIITGIGNSAFAGNTSITGIVLPESLESIGNNAFSGCYNLTNVTPFLPGSLITLGSAAFFNCTDLTGNLTLSNQDLKTVSENCFNSAKVSSVDMSDSGITTIARRAFANNAAMTEAVLPEILEYIADEVFSRCSSLTNVTPFLPASVTNILQNAFYNCANLTSSLVLSNPDLTNLNNNTFYNTKIGSVDMTGSGILTIGYRAFNGCASISSIRFPKSLTTFGNEVFSGCKAVTQVWYCGDVPVFGSSVFYGWTGFQARFYIPRGNESWEEYKDNPAVSFFAALSPGEEELFNDTYPGEQLPIGKFGLVGSSSVSQWYCLWNPLAKLLQTIIIIR